MSEHPLEALKQGLAIAVAKELVKQIAQIFQATPANAVYIVGASLKAVAESMPEPLFQAAFKDAEPCGDVCDCHLKKQAFIDLMRKYRQWPDHPEETTTTTATE